MIFIIVVQVCGYDAKITIIWLFAAGISRKNAPIQEMVTVREVPISLLNSSHCSIIDHKGMDLLIAQSYFTRQG